MANSTTHLSLTKPEATDSTKIREDFNDNMDLIDTAFEDVLAYDTSPVLRGNLDIGAFTIEGVDATELAILDGATLTTTELNYVDGVTSAIQTQLDGKQPLDSGLTSIAGLTTAADKMIYTTALDTYAVTDLTAFARSILDDADEATFKATVNLEIGTDVQAYDATLLSIAALGTAADKIAYTTDVDTWAETTCTAAGRALIDDADNVAQLVTLGLTATAAELNVLDGITSTTAELNILDGVTATASEINILDGATLTVTELNYVDGVTSSIQTQIDSKEGTLTDSAGLAAALSDETGTGKAVFNTAPTIKQRVTTVTTTHTMTVDEAGTVLVSASSDYTITLPTAVGNTGLTYHFKKTDANYNCITLDGDGTETINYENSTSAPVQTYARLNTYGAEVTLVSDGSNWQAYDEKLGQVPFCRAYLNGNQLNLTSAVYARVELNAETYDIGDNFDYSTWVSGNATSTVADHLVDSGGSFTSDMVGKRVKNTTDDTYTYVTAYNSATDLTVRDDIFVDTEGYEIKHAKFVCPISGNYEIKAFLSWMNNTVIADKRYILSINENNDDIITYHTLQASCTNGIQNYTSLIFNFSKDDYIEIYGRADAGVDTVDIQGGEAATGYIIRLIAKD